MNVDLQLKLLSNINLIFQAPVCDYCHDLLQKPVHSNETTCVSVKESL